MHSRIFKIVGKDCLDLVKKSPSLLFVYEEEVPHFADYVVDSDLDEDFKWLVSYLKKCENYIEVSKDHRSIIFLKGFKHFYFESNFNILKEIFNSDDGLDKFINNSWLISNLVDEKFSFYVADEYNCWETFDSFLRYMEEDKIYYVIDSVDYHY